ncbi:MAG: hypothetical protein D6749_14895 [Chloroflexota bacterium]|jgi:hypothetical protein|nr:MAG: hypothetical protein D6749_14895 [Chloroflexota bacterium]
MPVRLGLLPLIAHLRALCAVGEADLTVGALTYWTDELLQAELDATRRTVYGAPLIALPQFIDGAYRYYEYAFPTALGTWIEEAAPESGFAVRDAFGVAISSGFSVNYRARRVLFAEDQEGAAYTLDARSYDLYGAAASIWEQKAAFAAARVDWSATHGLKSSQEYEHCTAQAMRFRQLSGVRTATFLRTDEVRE